MQWNLSPRIIQGKGVQLEPLSKDKLEPLCECLLGEPDGWFSRMFGFNKPESITALIDGWTKANEERQALSFVSRDLTTQKIAGISHFMRIDEKNRQLEIGGTQVGQKFRRSHVNAETKYLMLREAFEALNAIRVFFKVDSENTISQKAILRIGVKPEGVLRNDCILPDGRTRDYQIYSVIDSEWPSVKNRLEQVIHAHSVAATEHGRTLSCP